MLDIEVETINNIMGKNFVKTNIFLEDNMLYERKNETSLVVATLDDEVFCEIVKNKRLNHFKKVSVFSGY